MAGLVEGGCGQPPAQGRDEAELDERGEQQPGERHQGEGQDAQGRPVEEGEQGAEGQADLPAPHGHGVASVDSGDWLDQEGGEQVRKTKINEK